jgi:hypothetical protein
VQIGIRDGWTTIQHHPVGRVIWDRHNLGIENARYIAFVHHLHEDEAVRMFGTKIKQEISEVYEKPSSLRVVKAIQYFDIGTDKTEPTEIWRLQSLGGRVLDVSQNKFGCLPFAHMQYMHPWGVRRPIGRVYLQKAGQEMRNAYERYQRLVLQRGPGFDAVDTAKLHPDDQAAFEEGELLAALRFEVPPMGKIGDYIQRVPAHEVPISLYKGLEMLDRNDPGESGISDADRANVTSSPRTLGEIEQAQAGADTQKEWSQRMYAGFLSRLFYKANAIAAKLHTAPTPLSINSYPVLFNEPGNAQSRLAYWLEPASWPDVNEDRLVRNSPMRRMQIAEAQWMPLKDDPYFNPIEVRRELLKGYGEKDVDRLLNPQAVAMMQGGSAMGSQMPLGAPMQPGMGQDPSMQGQPPQSAPTGA